MITRRQDFITLGDGHHVLVCEKACQTTEVIKWSMLLGLFALFFLWLMIGYWHARARIKKGLPPLRYHRWLAPRHRAPPQNSCSYYNPEHGTYGMQSYPEPPPIYSGAGMPPAYQPPAGASKMPPQQSGVIPASEVPR